MPLLTINHMTQYRYQQPVSLGEHRIMMRPREAFDQRLLSARLIINPEPTELQWLDDAFGHSVAIALFDDRADCLMIRSETTLEHVPLAQTQVDMEPYARPSPFTYSVEEMPDLLRSIERYNIDSNRVVDD